MAFSVEMPALGESVSEGTVTRWLKQEGDTVEVDEPLLEVSTDKVDTEIPSPVAGVLQKIVVQEDDTVEIGAQIAVINDSGEDDDTEEDEGDSGSQSSSNNDAANDSQEPEQKGSSGGGKGTEVTMPELGESVSEGTVTRWLKAVGDTVELDEPLLEVSTDKVDTEIPSPVAGILQEIIAEEDDTIEIGGKIAIIGDGSAASAGDSSGNGSAGDSDDADTSAADESDTDSSDRDSDDRDSDAGETGEGTEVTMPELGESVSEGTVTRWLKAVGDTVELDEPLLEVSTDKVDTEIPSPVAGVLQEIIAEEDDTIEIGGRIAIIGDGKAKRVSGGSKDSETAAPKKSPEKQPSKENSSKRENSEKGESKAHAMADATVKNSASRDAEKKSETKAATSETSGSGGSGESGKMPYVTPLVRKLAEENDIDLTTVKGTGIGGRIRKQDVLNAASGDSDASAEGSSSSSAAKTKKKGGPSSKGVRPELAELRGTTKKANRIRKITAKKTRESLQQSAQLTQVFEYDMTRVWTLRSSVKQQFQDKHGVKLTFLPFYAKAVVEALISHPNVNASYDEDANEITYHEAVNLGIAVDTEKGLLSPVIHNAHEMNIPQLASAIADIAQRARDSKLKPNDLQGGTFTITNIGSQGALFDTPILVPPQAAMLATGAIVQRPIVVPDSLGDDSIAIRHMSFTPMTYDHRLVDGADAGRFLSTVKDRLESAEFEDDLDL